ncbi:MAG: hypothetical protein M1281_14290, partial [Chloroflexi bacterium]|nr:hypothetical protein [Chloroflexota bacterium]
DGVSTVLDDFGGGNADPQAAFPATGVLDDFNREDGDVNNFWLGMPDGYALVSGQAVVGSSGELYWGATSFGADQEALVTLAAINPEASEIDLLLKCQDNDSWAGGVIEVWYQPGSDLIQVVTYTDQQGWVQQGADIPATFADGDRFRAIARADGTVEVYQNDTLLGARDVTAWPYYAGGGYLGLWTIGGAGTALDDFSGGDVPETPATSSTTITYTYDPLERLTAADYDNGVFFHYTYDAVGNRLEETTDLGATAYTYDDANRLTSVGGVTYTWDANGNLLNDGPYTYTYDYANRLTGVSGSSLSASYLYNGVGDRVRETVNGTNTTFTLDQAGGLTQVLADGTDTYLYGNGRIAQASTEDTQYFLGDALGSVRQLADSTGEVVLGKSYDPFGEELYSQGEATSSYAFTGEWMDSYSNLLYLRARYYSLGDGRFISKDTWQGDNNAPMSYNPWLYAYANSINYIDPTGLLPIEPPSSVFVDVNLSSSIPLNTLSPRPAQYYPYNNPRYFNLCGHISLEMIYETITGSRNSLDNFIRAYNSDAGTGIGNLEILVRDVFPSDWIAKGYSGREISVMMSGSNIWKTLPLQRNWWLDQNGLNNMRGILSNILARRHYIITSVVLDLNTGLVSLHQPSPQNQDPRNFVEHWVVLTGIQGGLVRINNPFANREEYVNWGIFNQSVIRALGTTLEIYPWSGEDVVNSLIPSLQEYGICP